MVIRLGFTGDVMLGRLVDRRQRVREPEAVWGDVLSSMRACDAMIINLECCLSTRGSPWTRTYRPFHFRAAPDWAVPALEAANITLCALANNHILDFEEPALLDTLGYLDDAGIARVGAGRTLDGALEPATFEVDGLTVGVVSFTDNTPEYAAKADQPGTAHIVIDTDRETTRSVVRDALDRTGRPDLLVASLHWGPNMVERPPASFRQFARWLIEEGVDIVHGHSAHVFHGVEMYRGRPILYDTGDFLDDYAVDERLRNDRSFLFEITVTDEGTIRDVTLSPTEIYDCSVHHAPASVAAWSRTRMRERSTEFGTRWERANSGLHLPVSADR